MVEALRIPPTRTPFQHPPARPLLLPTHLDPDTVLCLLPVRGTLWHDYSQSGYHCTLTSAAFSSKGRFGVGVLCSGVGVQVVREDPVKCRFTDEDFTVEAWVKPTALAGNAYIVNVARWNNHGYCIVMTASKRVQFITHQLGQNQTTQSSVGSITVGAWHHVVIARSGAAALIYVNGAFDVQSAGTHVDPAATTEPMTIGSGRSATGPLTGLIDELRIYKRLLSATEAKNLYEQGRP